MRAIDARAQAWIQAGAAGSETFRSLLARLSKSDLIVYVVIVDRISGGLIRSHYDSAAARVTESRVRSEFAGYQAGPPSDPESHTLVQRNRNAGTASRPGGSF